MKKTLLVLLTITVITSCNRTMKNKLEYPVTRKDDVEDSYFGTKVADPYRWLEDDRSLETTSWVKEQNKVTFGYLEKIPYREEIKSRLSKIWNYVEYFLYLIKNVG